MVGRSSSRRRRAIQQRLFGLLEKPRRSLVQPGDDSEFTDVQFTDTGRGTIARLSDENIYMSTPQQS
jgi:hypothetical protein